MTGSKSTPESEAQPGDARGVRGAGERSLRARLRATPVALKLSDLWDFFSTRSDRDASDQVKDLEDGFNELYRRMRTNHLGPRDIGLSDFQEPGSDKDGDFLDNLDEFKRHYRAARRLDRRGIDASTQCAEAREALDRASRKLDYIASAKVHDIVHKGIG